MIFVYLATLMIAPQLWVDPFVGVRVDLITYPLWFITLAAKDKLRGFFLLTTQDKIFLGMVVWFSICIIINEKNASSWTAMYEYFKWFVLYRLVFLSINSFDDIRSTVYKILFFSYLLVVESIQHKLSPDGIGWAGQTLDWVDPSVLRAGGTGRTRWVSIFDGPGVFCVIFTMALPFVIQFFDKHRPFFKKTVALIFLLPLLLAIYYTGSRGGLLATLAILGLYSMIRRGISIARMVMVGLALVLIFNAAPSHLTTAKDENKSAQHRVEMWIEGVEMVEQNPLFGIGKLNFKPYTKRLIAHNSAIEIMGENGLPGIFLWVSLMWVSFKSIFSYVKFSDNKTNNSYAMAVGLCLFGYLVSSMFVTLEYETLYFILALTASVGKQDTNLVKLTPKDARIILVGIFGFILFLKVFFRLYFG